MCDEWCDCNICSGVFVDCVVFGWEECLYFFECVEECVYGVVSLFVEECVLSGREFGRDDFDEKVCFCVGYGICG